MSNCLYYNISYFYHVTCVLFNVYVNSKTASIKANVIKIDETLKTLMIIKKTSPTQHFIEVSITHEQHMSHQVTIFGKT